MSQPVNTQSLLKLVRECDHFVVRDFTNVGNRPPGGPEVLTQPIVAVIPADALFEVIEDAHKHGKKITISPVGPPVINWA